MAHAPDGVLLLDKPAGYTSTRALSRAKRLLAARKAGHTGTLDPFATGLLPLVFGEATKFARFLIDASKSYVATLELGTESTTGDTEGDLTPGGPVDLDDRMIDDVLASFVGVMDQIPPMHSAVRVGGKRLYQLAREGVEIERAPRRIEIEALERVSLDGRSLVISVACSKGTYVRTLAADLGRTFGCGAYLTGLRRTGAGPFRLVQATTLEQLERDGVEEARLRLLPVEVLVAGLPRWDPGPEAAVRFTQGQVVDCPPAAAGDELAVFAGERLLGVGWCEVAGRLAPLRLMATQDSSKLPDFA